MSMSLKGADKTVSRLASVMLIFKEDEDEAAQGEALVGGLLQDRDAVFLDDEKDDETESAKPIKTRLLRI